MVLAQLADLAELFI